MKKKVDFILFQGALGLDITGPLEVFNTATYVLQKATNGSNEGYDIRLLSRTSGKVRLSSGFEIYAPHDFTNTSACDTLLVPGGFGTDKAMHDPLLIEYLRSKVPETRRSVSVCSGAFILASGGLLDNRRATTHWLMTEELQKQFPRVNVVADAIYINDGSIYTSGGVTAGIDLALVLVEEDFGIAVAMEVSRYLLVYLRRSGNQSQFSSILKSQVAAAKRFGKLHDWLMTNLTTAVSVKDMADHAAMSTRNFSRVFKKSTGLSPGRYLESLRLNKAREFLSAGDDSIKDIAMICGFRREDHMRRAFLRRFNVTPSQYRLNFQL